MEMSNYTQRARAPATNTRSSGLRTRPTQARSRKTFDGILSAAAELLIEAGWDGFNTNALAERAGCRIATLYRYFPDKLAVVSTLADSVVAEWDRGLVEFANVLAKQGDLRTVWPQFLRRFVSILKHNPSALAVRKAMQVVPEVRAIDQEDNKRLAADLGDAIIAHLPYLSKSRANSVARVLIESAVTIIDLVMTETTPEANRLLGEVEAMHLAYLNQLYAAKE